MKLVFILVLTAFTVCLSRELHRHRHEKKFPQGKETLQRDAYIGPKPGEEQNRLFPEYATNIRYIGEVKHGLDRVTLVVLLLLAKHFKMKSLIASVVIATLPPPSVAMIPSTGKLDLPGIQLIEPTLEHYLESTFFPFLGYIYKICKNIGDAFPESTDPTHPTYDDWTKAAILVKSENSKKVVCSYPITTMWRNFLGTMLICYAIIKYVRPMTWYRDYKYSRNFTFHLFVFCNHYYSPLKICPLRGHLQNYNRRQWL